MKKLSLAAIIVTVSISLAGCTNSETASNGNKTDTDCKRRTGRSQTRGKSCKNSGAYCDKCSWNSRKK